MKPLRFIAGCMVGFALAGIAYGLGNSTGAGDPSPPPKLAADALDRVADGDLIFRRGTDTSSAIVVSASSRGAQYSHVGVMIRQPTGLYVVHAMPAEGKKTGGVLMERLEDFIADDVSRFAAIIPVKGTEAERKTVTRYLTSLIGKAFDESAPIGAITPASAAPNIVSAAIALTVNGTLRQSSHIHRLIWNVAETIAHLSSAWILQPGDLIFTGTPEGVAGVQRGDRLCASIDGLSNLNLKIV